VARHLFGTDGIRGIAGEYPLDAKTVFATGAALGDWARHHSSDPEVVIGMDTRESGPDLARLVAGGLSSEGVRARFAGVITTPGVAWLTRNDTFVAGVMISASHNPYQDNGIKVFGHSGYKLPDEEEEALEARILQANGSGVPAAPVELQMEDGLSKRYLDYLASTISSRFDGLKVVLDCGHGAASKLAPELFERLGANVIRIGCAPDGRNINLDCGALHVNGLAKAVVHHQAQAGFAFDGDADRCIAVSASGRIVDGDQILLLAARRLGLRVVVATVMSNLGLEKALAAEGVELIRTPVGDKYVLEEMRRRGAVLGGEQSGHVIFLDAATTGDGILTALRVLDAMRSSGSSLDELTRGFEIYPQKLVNVRVRERRPLDQLPTVVARLREAEAELGSDGRVLLRFSGTEPLARVMVEGPTSTMVDRLASTLAKSIEAELGA
jgi:phosphoglucosamine mutase